ncbi:MAG: hypothetical protein Q4A82_00995 [Corynebacterium sp.]|nr:hypothetical protein [Corynebacterium sp.]
MTNIPFPTAEDQQYLNQLATAAHALATGGNLTIEEQRNYIGAAARLWAYLTQYEGQCVEENTKATLSDPDGTRPNYLDIAYCEHIDGTWPICLCAYREYPRIKVATEFDSVFFRVDPDQLKVFAAAIFSMLSHPLTAEELNAAQDEAIRQQMGTLND